MELNMIRIKNLIAIACIALSASCATVPLNPDYKDVNPETLVSDSYQQYIKLNADGTDINAMLAYCCLKFYLISPPSFDSNKTFLNDYLITASTEYISVNYPLVAGSNEVSVVSNFLFKTIGYLENTRVSAKEAPEQISSISQNLIVSIHEREFEKNE